MLWSVSKRKAWNISGEPLAELMEFEGVFQVKLDMCVFGLVTKDQMLALKPICYSPT